MSCRTMIVVCAILLVTTVSLAQADPTPPPPPTIQQLIEKFALPFQSPQPPGIERDKAISAAARMKDSFGPLAEALKNPDPNVRMGAVAALGMSMRKEAFDAIAQLSTDPDERVRGHAINVLTSLDSRRARGYRIAALRDKSFAIRLYQAQTLAFEDVKEAGDVALEALRRKETQYQSQGLQILSQLKDRRGIKEARKLLFTPAPKTMPLQPGPPPMGSGPGVGPLGPPPMGTGPMPPGPPGPPPGMMPGSTPVSLASAAASYLVGLSGYDALPDLIAALKRGGGVGMWVGCYGPRAFDTVVKLTTSKQAVIRWQALDALETMVNDRIAPPPSVAIHRTRLTPEQCRQATLLMVRLMENQDAMNRYYTAQSIANGDPEVALATAERMVKSPSVESRLLAFEVSPDGPDGCQEKPLTAAMAKRVRALMMRGLQDKDKSVRWRAVRTTSWYRLPEAVNILANLLGGDKGEDPEGRPEDGLRLIGAKSIPAILKVAQSTKHPGRINAIALLGQFGLPQGIEGLLPLIDDADPSIRRTTFTVLRTQDPRITHEALTKALGDADPAIRALAVEWLSDTGYPEVISRLRVALKDSDQAVRERAAVSLAKRGDDAGLDTLISGLGDASPERSEPAEGALRVVRSSWPVERVIELLRKAPDPQLIQLLGYLRDARAADALEECLSGKYADQAAIALGMLGDMRALGPLTAIATRESDPGREDGGYEQRAVWELRKLGDAGFAAFVKLLESENWAALASLEKVPEPRLTTAQLLPLLKSDDRSSWLAAIQMLATADTAEAIAALRTLAESGEDKIPQVVSALRWNAPTLGIQALRTMIHSPNPRLRFHAAWMLSETKEPDVLDVLADAMKSEDPRNARWAAALLVRAGDLRAFDYLAGNLQSKERREIESAISGLSAFHSPNTVSLVRPFLDSKDGNVRAAAALALIRLGDVGSYAGIERAVKTCGLPLRTEYVKDELGDLPSVETRDILWRLLPKCPDSRAIILKALVKLKDQRAFEPLIADADRVLDGLPAGEQTDTVNDPWLLLAELEPARARPLLLRLLGYGSAELRGAGLIGLARAGAPDDIKLVTEAVRGETEEVRAGVTRELAKLEDPLVRQYIDQGVAQRDPAVIFGALDTLIADGDEANIPVMLTAFRSSDNGSYMAGRFLASGHPVLVAAAQDSKFDDQLCYHPEEYEADSPKWGSRGAK